MDSFSLCLVVFVVFSSMAAYFAVARQAAEAEPAAPIKQPFAPPSAPVHFVHADTARLQQPARIHPVLRQNVAAARLMRLDRLT